MFISCPGLRGRTPGEIHSGMIALILLRSLP